MDILWLSMEEPQNIHNLTSMYSYPNYTNTIQLYFKHNLRY